MKLIVTMDSNEKPGPRPTALARAIGADPAYELAGFAELPVDLQIRLPGHCPEHCENAKGCGTVEKSKCGQWISERVVNVELKEIDDFWASKSTGHLGQQLIEMIAAGQPGLVAVFGGLAEVLREVPKVKSADNPSGMRKAQARSQMDIQADVSTARAFCADAAAANVPVHFLAANHQQSFGWVLSYAKHILGSPNLASWLPRFPVEPRGYACLCSVPGIGDVAARGLLRAYGGVGQIANEAKFNPEALARCQVNGKAMGKAKAGKLIEVLG